MKSDCCGADVVMMQSVRRVKIDDLRWEYKTHLCSKCNKPCTPKEEE